MVNVIWYRSCLAALFIACIFAGNSVRADELRALWVDAWHAGYMTPTEVSSLVSKCREYNFNSVFVQMRRRGDAWYIPQAPNGDPRTTALPVGYDALAEVIRQCHAAEPPIQVHCWAITHLVWSDATNPPSQPGHVYNLHPEYLTKSSTGATRIGEGFYVDPGHPGATQWNYNMAIDVVSRYSIDGFHWDYIRYPTTDAGYNDTALARYNSEFELSGKPSPSDAQWSDWRRRQVTDFLRWTNADLLAIRPDLQVSAAVFGSRSDAYNARFQDWSRWNHEGIIDLCMPMNYTANNATFNSRADDAFAHQGARWVIMGQGSYLNTRENTVDQLLYSRSRPFSGTILYSYAVPNSGAVDQAGTFAYIRDQYQPVYEPPPLLPWKIAPAKGILKGTVTSEEDAAPIYNAAIRLEGPAPMSQKSEVRGKYVFFETEPGTYTVQASSAGRGLTTKSVTIAAGSIVVADLQIPAADNLPPVISEVLTEDVADVSAVISWLTDEPTHGAVEYGTSTAYGNSVSSIGPKIRHSLGLSGLTPSTTYHFRITAQDPSGNGAASGDSTFTTNVSGGIADIIIDNPAAVITGTWSTGTSAVDKFGADYRFRGKGSGSFFVTYKPTIQRAGSYLVYEWHPQGSNRTSGAPHIINHAGGSNTVLVDQKQNGGRWNRLGSFYLNEGTAGYIRISDAFTDTASVVMADAVKFVYEPPPAAPRDLSAIAGSPTTVVLSWTDMANNETGFSIRRSSSAGGPYTEIGTAAADAVSFEDSTASPDSNFYYTVYATNASGVSAASNEASVRTPPLPPAAPSGLVADTLSSSEIILSWVDNADNEDLIVVGRSTTAGGPYPELASLPANTTSYIDSNAAPDTTYYYVVHAANAGGSSGNSNEASATTLPLPPETPQGLSAVAGSSIHVDLSWSDVSSNEEAFIVGRAGTAGGPYNEIATLDANTTSHRDLLVNPDSAYYYVIRAINRGGSSPWSNEASVATPALLEPVKVHIKKVAMVWVKGGNGFEAHVKVDVVSNMNIQIKGARVKGHFAGVVLDTNKYGITDDEGQALIVSSPTVQDAGTALFTVTEIVGDHIVYDAAANVAHTAEAAIPGS
ncbi:MAG: family 10 glycosylhydrolase [Candidatus Sumerlaeaceae bacterium]